MYVCVCVCVCALQATMRQSPLGQPSPCLCLCRRLQGNNFTTLSADLPGPDVSSDSVRSLSMLSTPAHMDTSVSMRVMMHAVMRIYILMCMWHACVSHMGTLWGSCIHHSEALRFHACAIMLWLVAPNVQSKPHIGYLEYISG